MERKKLISYIKKTYGAEPEYLWRRYPEYVVFRHGDNRKWFGGILNVRRESLGLPKVDDAVAAFVDVLNVKVADAYFRDLLLQKPGIFPAYHMSRGGWVSLLLDGTVPDRELKELLAESYAATASKEKARELRGPKDWLIPANSKWFDVVHMFDEEPELEWNQGKNVKPGDTVYIYVTAPYSAILFGCSFLEGGRLKLVRRYMPKQFPLSILKERYGVTSVRGRRGIPESLSEDLLKRAFAFRYIRPEEAERAADIEWICFPPHEACSRKSMRERVKACPDQFLVAEDTATGEIVGFLNGAATMEHRFRDEFFLDISLHDPKGTDIMLMGLDVIPEYRSIGLARMLMDQYAFRERKKGRKRLVLTCLEEKVHMYETFGYRDLGLSDSAWGSESWHEMELIL